MIPAYFLIQNGNAFNSKLSPTENYTVPHISTPNLLLKCYWLKKWPSSLAYLGIFNTEIAFKHLVLKLDIYCDGGARRTLLGFQACSLFIIA